MLKEFKKKNGDFTDFSRLKLAFFLSEIDPSPKWRPKIQIS